MGISNNLNGFSVHVNFTNDDLSYTVDHDSFSTIVHDNCDLYIVVQTSWKAGDSAKDIAIDYAESIRRDEKWVPSRYTKGSFLLIDKRKRLIIAGRDRSIASHLYYYFKDGEWLFTTDNRRLLEACKTIDAAALDMMLLHNFKVMASFPMIKGSKSLFPGHYVTVCPHGGMMDCEESVFWRVERCDVPSDYKDAVVRYGELLVESIKNNIDNDTAAVWLSGGSDSAAIMGALHKLGVKNSIAVHYRIKGNFDFENEDTDLLQNHYGFKLHNVIPDVHSEWWQTWVDETLANVSFNSLGMSVPLAYMAATEFRSVGPTGTTAMAGELCLLDAGYTESNDKSRNFRRWLYRGGGKWLAQGLKIIPQKFEVNWEKYRYSFKSDLSRKDKFLDVLRLLLSALFSLGRPGYYYAGMKIGAKRCVFPTPFLPHTFLPSDYNSDRWNVFYNGLFEDFEKLLKISSFHEAYNTLLCKWYSEFSNFSMYYDACSYGNLKYCMPFSSVELIDYQSSLPEKWVVDKKLQKDMCYYYLNMPEQVSYRLKNHNREIPYEQLVYPYMLSSVFSEIFNERFISTDFGPLDQELKRLNYNQMGPGLKFALYGIMLQIEKYNLKIE